MNRDNKRCFRNRISKFILLVLLLSVAMTVSAVAASGSIEMPINYIMGIDRADWLTFSGNWENAYIYGDDKGSGGISISGNTVSLEARGYYNGKRNHGATTTTLTIKNNRSFAIYVYYELKPGSNYNDLGNKGTKQTSGEYNEKYQLRIDGNGTVSVTLKSNDPSSADDRKMYSASLKIVGIEVVPAERTTTFTFSADASINHGSYTVTYNGAEVAALTPAASGTQPSVQHKASSDPPYVLTATPESGYAFCGWASSEGYLSSSPTFEYDWAQNNMKIWPVFGAAGSALIYVEKDDGTTSYFSNFDEAMTAAAAAASKTAVLISSGKVKSTDASKTAFEIPEAVSFLIPYNIAKLGPRTTEAEGSGHPYALTDYFIKNSIQAYNESVYYELEVPAGITVTVKGKLILGGLLGSTTGIAGSTVSTHSNIKLDGTIIVDGSSAVLSCCGYIYGKGSVAVQNGGTVYEPFIVADFYGGTFTLGAGGRAASVDPQISSGAFKVKIEPDPPGDTPFIAASETESAVMPFLRWTMLNIQTELKVLPQGKLKGYVDLYAMSMHNRATVTVISAENALLLVGENTVVTCTYKANSINKINSSTNGNLGKIGKTTIRIDNGGAALGTLPIQITIQKSALGLTVTVAASLASEKMAFPIPYNIDIVLGGNADASSPYQYRIDRHMLLLPGAGLTVEDGAELTIGTKGKLAVFSTLYDQKRTSSGADAITIAKTNFTNSGLSAYPTYADLKAAESKGFSATADFVVKGTLKIEGRFGGIVQTDEKGTGVIETASNAALDIQSQIGTTGNSAFTVKIVGALFGTEWYSQSFNLNNVGATVHSQTAQVYNPYTGSLVSLAAGKTYRAIPKAALSYTSTDYTYKVYTNSGDRTIFNQVSLNSDIYKKDLELITEGGWYQFACPTYAVYHPLAPKQDGYAYVMEGTDLSSLGYYTDEALSTAASSIGGVINLYKAAVAVNFSKTAENEVTAKSAYLSLDSAAENYTADGAAYIQMQANDTNGAELADGTVLDLNGHTVAGVTTTGTIKGVDSSSDGFKTPSGSLTVTDGAVETVAQVNGKDYVAVQKAGTSEYSFHRFAITPIACKFYLDVNSKHTDLEIKAALQGDDTIFNEEKKLLKYLGFQIDGRETDWYGTKEPVFSGTDSNAGNNRSISYIAFSNNEAIETEYREKHTIIAVAAFDDGKKQLIKSSEHSISLYQVLSQYVEKNAEIEQASRISAFLQNLTSTAQGG